MIYEYIQIPIKHSVQCVESLDDISDKQLPAGEKKNPSNVLLGHLS